MTLIHVYQKGAADLRYFTDIREVAAIRHVVYRMVVRVAGVRKEKERLKTRSEKRIAVALGRVGVVVDVPDPGVVIDHIFSFLPELMGIVIVNDID